MPSDIKRVQYAQLARSLRGRPLAELISRATTEPDLATFGDLLHLTAVQEVRLGDWRPWGCYLHRGTTRLDTDDAIHTSLHSAPPQLSNTEDAAALSLLNLFSYGTWQDYSGNMTAPGRCGCIQRRLGDWCPFLGLNPDITNFPLWPCHTTRPGQRLASDSSPRKEAQGTDRAVFGGLETGEGRFGNMRSGQGMRCAPALVPA